MHDVSHYDEAELRLFWSQLILAVYYEFCYKQREYGIWQAGFEVLQQLPVE